MARLNPMQAVFDFGDLREAQQNAVKAEVTPCSARLLSLLRLD